MAKNTSAIDRVCDSLARDEQKASRRHAAAPLANRDDHDDDDSDSDTSEIAINARLKRRTSFQRAFGLIKNFNVFVRSGVRHKHLRNWFDNLKPGARKTQENQLFITHVLNSVPLMAQTSALMRDLYAPFLGHSEYKMAGPELLSLVARTIHQVKIHTAQECWTSHIVEGRRELSELQAKYRSQSEQLQLARASYLEEVAALRDEVRVRGDPLAGDLSLDVVHFYEPTHALSPTERKHLLAVVREKFKMMAENNPKVVRTYDFGQLEQLIHQVESHECEELRAALKRKSDELVELRKSVQNARNLQFSQQVSGGQRPRASKLENDMIASLEQQVQSLQADCSDLQNSLRLLKSESEETANDRDKLSRAYKEESVKYLLLKTEFEKACERCNSFEVSLQEQEVKELDLVKQIEEFKTLKQLQHIDDAQATYTFNGEMGIVCSDDGIVLEVMGHTPAHTKGIIAGQKIVNVGTDEFSQERLGRAETSGSDYDITVRMSMNVQYQALLREHSDMKARYKRLENLVREHIEGQAVDEAELASKEAEQLAEYAQAFGCEVQSDAETQDVRVCACGNVLMEDAMFCRKCGAEWKNGKGPLVEADITQLVVRLGDLDGAIAKSTDRLNGELQKHREADTDPIGDEINSTRTDAIKVKDVESLRSIQTMEQEHMRLKREKAQAEARLLVMLSRRACDAAEALEETQASDCKCACAEKLAVIKELCRKFRQLCGQLAGRLKVATVENLQLSTTILAVQEKIDIATKAIDESEIVRVAAKQEACQHCGRMSDGNGGSQEALKLQKGLQALEAAKHRSVFQRLYADARRRGGQLRPNEDRKYRLMQETCNAIYSKPFGATLSICDDTPFLVIEGWKSPAGSKIAGETNLSPSTPSVGDFDLAIKGEAAQMETRQARPSSPQSPGLVATSTLPPVVGKTPGSARSSLRVQTTSDALSPQHPSGSVRHSLAHSPTWVTSRVPSNPRRATEVGIVSAPVSSFQAPRRPSGPPPLRHAREPERRPSNANDVNLMIAGNSTAGNDVSKTPSKHR